MPNGQYKIPALLIGMGALFTLLFFLLTSGRILSPEEAARRRLRLRTLSLVGSWSTDLSPYAIDICDGGPVLVSDISTNIMIYSTAGTYQSQWSVSGSGGDAIRGLTVDNRTDSGRIYLAMYLGDYVHVLNRDGTPHASWQGTTDQQTTIGPHAFIVLSDGNLIISDDTNHCLQLFEPDGTYVKTIGSYGEGQGQFKNPRQLAYDDRNGDIYVVDRNNHRIQVVDINGTYRRGWGSEGSAVSSFNQPHGIALNKVNNIIYVGDTYNDRIQVFNTDGVFLNEWKSPDFRAPRYMVVDSSGRLYVTSVPDKKVGIFEFKR